MRWTLPVGLGTTALLISSVLPMPAAVAEPPAPRTVTRTYNGVGGVTVSDYPGVFVQDASPNGADTGESVGGVAFWPEPPLRERWFRIEATDISGQPVAVRVFWIRPGTTAFGAPKTFCDGTTPLLRTHPRGFVQTFLVAGPCGAGVSAPTRGEMSATFSSAKF